MTLSAQSVLDPSVPAAWEPVLVDLQAFLELEETIRRQKLDPSQDQRRQLIELHDRLVTGSATLLDPAAVQDLSEVELIRLFATSVLLLTRLEESVMADDEVLDTAGSQTLALYEADFYCSAENLRAVRAMLEEKLGLSAPELAALESDVDEQLGDARQKQALVRAVRQEFGLWPQAPDLRRSVHELFSALFPDVPLLPEEVELILTGTLIFFCIPFDGEELMTPRFGSLAESDSRPIRDFLAQVNGFKQQRFAHFPAFGFLQAGQLDTGLLNRLGERADIEPELVAQELCRMVTILPLAELDKYVVHDVWGHSWQASMLRFEHGYEEMARYADRLRLEDTAWSEEGGSLRFADCFPGSGAELRFDARRFGQFVHGKLSERLPVALSAALAELMADVAEFKFPVLYPDQAGALPSSSVFKSFPSKLDLTLQDAQIYFKQATKVFRFWASRANWQAKTRAELIQRGAAPEAAEAALREAVKQCEALVKGHWAPRLWWQAAAQDRLKVSAFTLVALNFLGIHRALLETYGQLDDVRPETLPVKSYRDLLVIAASVFFEADRRNNLWRVDEYLSLCFLPLCRRMGLGR